MNPLPQLIAQLDALEAALPQLMDDHPDEGDFWMAFAGNADVIEDAAGEHAALVSERIERMLEPFRELLAERSGALSENA